MAVIKGTGAATALAKICRLKRRWVCSRYFCGGVLGHVGSREDTVMGK